MMRLIGEPATVNGTALLETPATVTIAFPELAPSGTNTTMLFELQHVEQGVAVVPLKATVLDPWVAPRFAPVIVTGVPIGPELGFKLVILGLARGDTTVKLDPLLATPDTVTTTFPVIAPAGTVAKMVVELQSVGVAVTPLNVTTLEPCIDPKFSPVMMTEPPMTPEIGDRDVIAGADDEPEAELTDTLSNVAVPKVVLLPLATTKPTYTFGAMVTVSLAPNCTQFTPSADE
jgi:hypothetical protein